MIEILETIDNLKSIKKMVEDQKPRYLIAEECDKMIATNQKKVDEFEKWADEESQKEQNQIEIPFPEGVR
tara:strand:+ start:310 stop:519 length:210 start_codon:yes stop_codon:yes gene_type:complete